MPTVFTQDTSTATTTSYAYNTGYNNIPINSNVLFNVLTQYDKITDRVTALSTKQDTLIGATNLLGIGSQISSLDYNKITLNKPTNFQADWTTTVINKPTNFQADWATTVINKPTNFQADWATTVINKPDLTPYVSSNYLNSSLLIYDKISDRQTAITALSSTYVSSNVLNNFLLPFTTSNVLNNYLSIYDKITDRQTAITALSSTYVSSNVLNNYLTPYTTSNVLNNYLLIYDKITDRQTAITALSSTYVSSNVLNNYLTPFTTSNVLNNYLLIYDKITDRQTAITALSSTYVSSNVLNNYLLPFTTSNVLNNYLSQYTTNTNLTTLLNAKQPVLIASTTLFGIGSNITNIAYSNITGIPANSSYLPLTGGTLSGSIGIGTTIPEQSLDVIGNIKANNLYIYNPLSNTRSISFTPKPTTLSDFLKNNIPYAMYFAEDYNTTTNIFPNYLANGRDGAGTGTITKTTASGNGASGNITYISGGTTAKVLFPIGTLLSPMTLLTLSRYNAGTRGKIIQGDVTNTTHGQRGGYKGIVSYNGSLLTSGTPAQVGNVDDWCCTIAKQGGTIPNNVLVDGTAIGVNVVNNPYTLNPDRITINGSSSFPVPGDWCVSCIIIFDKTLSDADMVYLNGVINTYKSTGINAIKQSLYDECVIENRSYGTSKQTELLLFKGNDVNSTDGYDRIRLKGANILFDTYDTTTTDKTIESTKMIINTSGNIGIGNPLPMALLSLGRPDVYSDGALSLSKKNAGGWRNFRIGIDDSFNLCLGDYGSATSGNTWASTQLTINYNTGNIGIGAVNQSQKLYVNGTGYINGNTGINGTLNVGDITSSGNFLINKANPVVNFSGTNEGDIVTLFLGTPYANTGAYKTAIIAEGKTGWSRSYLHFCLNNNGADNTRPTQNAGLNNIRFTIRPDGNFNFYPDPFYINNTNGVNYSMNLNVATNTTFTPSLSTFLQATVADGFNGLDTIVTLACSGSANSSYYNGSRIVLDGSYNTNASLGTYASYIAFQSQNSAGGWNTNAYLRTTNSSITYRVDGNISCFSLTQTSTTNIKTDIQPIENALNIITQLEGHYYKNIKTDNYDYGFIAEEIEIVLPDIVDKTNEDLIGISYTSLIPILIEGIKELNKNNQEIRTELNQMKEDMKQMKELLNQFMQKV